MRKASVLVNLKFRLSHNFWMLSLKILGLVWKSLRITTPVLYRAASSSSA